MSATPEKSQSQKNLRGIGLMMLGMSAFVISDAILKVARRDLEAGQILFVRGLFALAMLLALLAVIRRLGLLRDAWRWQLVTRGGLEAVIALLFITAIGAMTLADITAVLMVAPLLITAISVLLFGEKVGWRRWLAVSIGFAGVLLVLQPGGSTVPLWAGVMAALSALGVAMRDLLTRRIPATLPSLAITFTSTLFTMLGGGVMMVTTGDWRPLSLTTLMSLAGAAVCVLIGNYSVIEAHRDTDLSVVSPFRFSIILLAVVLGIVVFGDFPSLAGAFGAALIISSGIYTAHREHMRQREARGD